MTSREQIYKAALDEQAGWDSAAARHRIKPDGVSCSEWCNRANRARAALEAAAKVRDDIFVCNAICCDDSHPDHAQELRRLLAEAKAGRLADDLVLLQHCADAVRKDGNKNRATVVAGIVIDAIDAYLRGAR